MPVVLRPTSRLAVQPNFFDVLLLIFYCFLAQLQISGTFFKALLGITEVIKAVQTTVPFRRHRTAFSTTIKITSQAKKCRFLVSGYFCSIHGRNFRVRSIVLHARKFRAPSHFELIISPVCDLRSEMIKGKIPYCMELLRPRTIPHQ